MLAAQGPSQVRAKASFFTGPRLDWTLALSAISIGVIVYLLGDRTNWSGGLGYDGRFYGELAKNFPSAVFGHGAVIPPGFEPYAGPRLSGLDSYYAFRIVPSLLVWIGLKAISLSPTDGHVIGLFAGLNSLMFGLATFCWCRSAGLLGLGDREKLLGTGALLLSFAVLKTSGYFPVLTDQVALGLGALSLYLWLRGSLAGLAACTFVACFTWPLHFVIGGLLLLFPPPRQVAGRFAEPAAQLPPRSWRPSRFPLALGLLAGGAAVVAVTAYQLEGHVSIEGTRQLPVFPLSVAITGLYTLGVVAFFAPATPARLWRVVRSIPLRRLLVTIGVIAGARVAGALLARRAGFSGTEILREELWWTTLDPGIFIVMLISYFGPLMLALLADLPRAAADSWRLGPGMALVVAVGLLGALTTHSREISDVVPFLLLPGVLAVRRLIGLSTGVLLGFLAVSLAWSRVWLHVGPLETSFPALQHFPAQSYYMALGGWTPPGTYAIQLAGVALTAVAAAALVFLRRWWRPGRLR